MEKLTASELKDNLDFSKNIDGVETSITEGHELFEANLQSWLINRINENWQGDKVILTPEDSEPFTMTREEYKKL